jgi:DNA-binding beta-propeller fold protein YncE
VIHHNVWGVYYNSMNCFFHYGTSCTNRDGGVTVIDGGTNQFATVPTGTDPAAIALDSVTNKVYVADTGDETVGEITILDGATNKVMSMNVPGAPGLPAVAVNSVTNKIYVTFPGFHKDDESFAAGNMVVVDGTTNEAVAKSYDSKVQPCGIAVNAMTNRVYVINRGSKDVAVMLGFTADAAPSAPGTMEPR